MKKIIFSILLGVCVLLGLSACQLTYLMKSAYHQADLLRKRVPIEEVLGDPAVPEETKRKLRLAQEARLYSEQRLSLKATQNYTSYVQLDRPYVSYVVSAAPKNKLEHHLWKYPIVGSLPYKGFPDPESAREEAEKLMQQGLDVFIRGVSAYSTLGWFKDPVLSSMMAYDDHDLVNTIVHETVHATVFVKSEADFNERLASFIGNKGTEKFYTDKEGPSSKTLQVIVGENADERLFSNFISKEIEALEKWYEEQSQKTLDENVRQARLKEIQTRFATEVRPHLKIHSYKDFEKVDMNNARLLTYRLYQKDLSDFETVFKSMGSDFSKFLDFCKTLEDEEAPEEKLKGIAASQ